MTSQDEATGRLTRGCGFSALVFFAITAAAVVAAALAGPGFVDEGYPVPRLLLFGALLGTVLALPVAALVLWVVGRPKG